MFKFYELSFICLQQGLDNAVIILINRSTKHNERKKKKSQETRDMSKLKIHTSANTIFHFNIL